jgi:hypothetical protein
MPFTRQQTKLLYFDLTLWPFVKWSGFGICILTKILSGNKHYRRLTCPKNHGTIYLDFYNLIKNLSMLSIFNRGINSLLKRTRHQSKMNSKIISMLPN